MPTLSKSKLAQFVKQRAEQQAQRVDPSTLAQAVDANLEAQKFCWWARLCIHAYGRITPILKSYLDERCPGFVQSVRTEASSDFDELAFWHALRKWIEDHVFERAVREGWRDALAYYTAADSRSNEASDHWLKTQQALDDDSLTEIPLYEIWRDESQDG